MKAWQEYKISVVVPVYNTASYLPRCVETLLDQSFPPYEILLVNDGSTDTSGEICNTFAAQYPTVHVFHKANSGPQDTRQFGVAKATGSHIAMVDSDDFIHREMYSLLARQMAETGTDISACGFRFSHEPIRNDFEKELGSVLVFEVFKRYEAYAALLRNDDMMPSLNNKLYRADLFEGLDWGIHFRSYEDLYANLTLFKQAGNGVALCRKALYGYYVRDSSLSRQPITINRINDMLAVSKSFCDMARGDAQLATLAKCCYRERAIYAYTQIQRSAPSKDLSTMGRRLRQEIRKDLIHTLADSTPSIYKFAAIGTAFLHPLYNLAARLIKPMERDTR